MSSKPGSPSTKPPKDPKAPKEKEDEKEVDVSVLPYPVSPGTLAMPEETLAEVEHKLGHIRTDLTQGYPSKIKEAMRAKQTELLGNLAELVKATTLSEKDKRKWATKLKAFGV